MQTAKDKDGFGKGDIRGVIGPESSNNAKEGGGLVPTLLFGIPGSGSMAVFIGGMSLLGYDTGPQMISNDLPITYTIVWSLAFANVLGAGLCIGLSGGIARLTTIRFALLVPFLFMMISFAAFQSRQTLWDLGALVAVGLLGIFMRRFEWPRPAFLIGFVLADQAEVYTYQATQIAMSKFRRGTEAGLEYLLSPTVLILIVIIIVSVWLGSRQKVNIGGMAESKQTVRLSKTAPVIFTALVTAFMGLMFLDALSLSVLIDKVFPLALSGFAAAGGLLLHVQMWRGETGDGLFADAEVLGEDADAPHGLWPTLAWFFSLLLLTALFVFFDCINNIFRRIFAVA